MPSLRRRSVLGMLATGTVASLAGCASSSCPDETPPPPNQILSPDAETAGSLTDVPSTTWPSVRGDSGNTGFAPAATTAFESPTVRWRTSISVAEYSSQTPGVVGAPLVADGLVILWAPNGLRAFDIRNGQPVWTNTDLTPTTIDRIADRERPRRTAFPPTATTPPAADDNGTVYVGETDGLTAIDTADGSVRWRFTDVGTVGPPTVTDEAVFVTADAGLIAVDVDGRERWRWEATLKPRMGAGADGTVVIIDLLPPVNGVGFPRHRTAGLGVSGLQSGR